ARDSAANLGTTKQQVVRLDKTPPAMSTAPGLSLAVGQQVGSGGGLVPTTVSGWAGSDPGTSASGLDHFTLSKTVDGGPAVDVALPTSLATSVDVPVTVNSTVLFTAGAVDLAGNPSTGVAGSALIARLRQETSPDIVDTGSWTTQAAAIATGGGTQFASS